MLQKNIQLGSSRDGHARLRIALPHAWHIIVSISMTLEGPMHVHVANVSMHLSTIFWIYYIM